MSFAPSSPVTGGPQTGLTSPTYTIVSDTPPNSHSVQYAVTTLGGTQTGVEAHSVSLPFTLTMERPAQFRQLGVANPVTGVISNVPMNVFKIRARKGVNIDASQSPKVASVEIKLSIPAGADTEDPESIRAMLSLAAGALWAESADVGDALIDGLI